MKANSTRILCKYFQIISSKRPFFSLKYVSLSLMQRRGFSKQFIPKNRPSLSLSSEDALVGLAAEEVRMLERRLKSPNYRPLEAILDGKSVEKASLFTLETCLQMTPTFMKVLEARIDYDLAKEQVLSKAHLFCFRNTLKKDVKNVRRVSYHRFLHSVQRLSMPVSTILRYVDAASPPKFKLKFKAFLLLVNFATLCCSLMRGL